MLNRLCQAESIPLVNVVRSEDQAALLRSEGASNIVDSSSANFDEELREAVAKTEATLCYDAIGGGELASKILSAMEAAARQRVGAAFSRYGSPVHKQVYVYGGLDMRPTVIDRSIGTAWGVGGFLLTTFLTRVPATEAIEMRDQVARNLATIFASAFDRTVGLSTLLDPEILRTIATKATGRKTIIDLTR